MKKIDEQQKTVREESFHDHWAESVKVENIDVLRSNEAVTAPEMRYIMQQLGDLRGKRVLDLGCGLGEASVYFALQGACVTSADLSERMLQVTQQVAARYGVTLNTCKVTAEHLQLGPEKQFDVVYAGNLFHHVDIDATLEHIVPFIKDDGVLVSWDPLAYNPLINMYRWIARDVRTADEHPLTVTDLKRFDKYFRQVRKRYFWLTTLSIFVLMVVFQFKNPNKERFWKLIIEESDKWSVLYTPLERVDNLLLKWFPALGLLGWNVVIIAKHPRQSL